MATSPPRTTLAAGGRAAPDAVEPARRAVGSWRRVQRMLAGALLFLAWVAGTNWLMDPYGVWQRSLADSIYRKLDARDRVTTPYLLTVEQPETILIGSSRVLFGMAIEQGCRHGVMNAALKGATLDEITALIGLALRNPRLRRMVWGVDFYAFDDGLDGFRDPRFSRRLAGDRGLLIREMLLNLDALRSSGTLLVRTLSGRERLLPTQTAPVPWPPRTIARALDEARPTNTVVADETAMTLRFAEWLPGYGTYRPSARHLAAFRDAVARARAAGIEVHLFIPPLSAYELEAIRQWGQWDAFQRWKRELAAVEPYWDFSGYNDLAFADHLFLDTVHFKPEVGHVMLRRLLERDCDQCGENGRLVLRSGVWVDAETADTHLTNQEAARRARVQEASAYGRRLALYRSRVQQPRVENWNPPHLHAAGAG